MPNKKVTDLTQIYVPLSNDLCRIVRSGVSYKATPDVIAPILFSSGSGVLYLNSRQIPASGASAGVSGQFTFKDSFVYVHVGTGWLRSTLSSFG